ncbi:DNA-binding transcriptional regulator [Streptomyces sp. NPDC126514]|uniref:XylR family transcriptional regulator n=1 Tax=Streptomyces sp. NPDC126514 TaxID=3155210 RepID=UPI00332BD58A
MPRRSTPRQVALVVETSNAYARGLLTGIRKFVLSRPNWSLYLVEHSRYETDFSWLHGWRGDGVLARIENEETAHLVRTLALPTVDLSAKRLVPEIPCVETDDAMIADLAVKHFTEQGLRRFAYCGDPRFRWSIARAKAFTQGARAHGTDAREFLMDASAMRADERRRLASWLRTLPRPVGVLACYDIAGQEVLEACALADLRVPDDVAVLGVDNDELFCNLTSPPLSSVQPDALHTGFLAAEILDDMMTGLPHIPDVHNVPPLRIATRQSSDVVAVDEPSLAVAMHYIRDHADQALTVESVVSHTPLSRRALEYRFTTLLGRTIHSEILRVRMARVADLLASTGWTLPRIAEHLSFPHSEYMGVTFKRHTGMSPGEYRRHVAGRAAS